MFTALADPWIETPDEVRALKAGEEPLVEVLAEGAGQLVVMMIRAAVLGAVGPVEQTLEAWEICEIGQLWLAEADEAKPPARKDKTPLP